jgi:hypothetical protein
MITTMTDEQDETYNDWTVAELKAEVTNRGLTVPSTANKADLVQALEEDDETDSEEDTTEVDTEDYDEDETEELPHPFGTCRTLAACECPTPSQLT